MAGSEKMTGRRKSVGRGGEEKVDRRQSDQRAESGANGKMDGTDRKLLAEGEIEGKETMHEAEAGWTVGKQWRASNILN